LASKSYKRTKPHRKLRTRAHIIEDLSIKHFTRHALLCGFSIEKFENDYGYDLSLFTYNEKGEIENGCITIQMKASDDVSFNSKDCIAFDLNTKDLNLWLNQFDPVLFVVYDAKRNKAFWINIQDYFDGKYLKSRIRKQQTYRVYIPRKNTLNTKSIRSFAKVKNSKYNSVDLFS
jgi:hypothetical protein